MSEADLYKLFSQYDGEADLSDFTPEELENLLGERKKSEKEKYFEYYDDVKSKSLKKQDWEESGAPAGRSFFSAGGRWKCERAGTGGR